MNSRQKLVQEQFLKNEKEVLRKLKNVYTLSLNDITKKSDELQKSIEGLQAIDLSGMSAEEVSVIKSMIQSKVYQKQYQEALKKQIGSILDNMQVEEFKTVSEYLAKCYEDGFFGTMYDIHGQGIPLIFPMDQEAIVRAVQLDSKISQGLYTRLGEDVALLKKKITSQISRGISTGMTFDQMAKQLAEWTNIGFNNAVRITRTEGHRIQIQSGMDACYKAKDMGADVVKQWDSTLDSSTRPSHQKVDGEIKELDEKFSNGLMFPGDPSGGAAEVVNCRCALLQRARWSLDEDELKTLKERAEYFGLDKTDSFDDFKNKYLKAAEEIKKQEYKQITFTSAKTKNEAEVIAQNVTKGTFSIDDSLNKDVYNGFNEAMYNVHDRYGKQLDISGLGKVRKSDARYQDGAYDPKTKRITVHNSARSVQAARNEKNFKSGWIASGYVYGTYYHEIGHAVWYDLPQDARTAITEIYKREKHDAFLKWKENGGSSSGISQTDVFGKKLSRYAHTDEKEFFSEAFSQIMSGRARPVSREVRSILEKYYKG